MTASNILLVITTTCTALIAGLLYAYSCSVNPGLKTLPDREYVAAMQAINRAIQNPVFFVSFMGTMLLLPVTAYVGYSQLSTQRFWLILVAAILYFTGVFCVTAFGNVPLNNTLDKFSLLNASPEAISLQRTNFEARWNNLHAVRTVFSIISLVLLITGCISNDKN